MKKYIYLSLTLLLTLGCVKEDIKDGLQNGTDSVPVFYAELSSAVEETKTFVDTDYFLYWTADDRISVFSSTYNQQYRFTGETGDKSGSFAKVQEDDFVTGGEIDNNYAVYPYSPQTYFGDDEIVFTLPSTQQYAKNSFGVGANTMVAATKNKDDNFLSFKNLCGYLVVNLYGEGVVKTISIKGNNGEKIAGLATMDPVYGEETEVTVTDSGTEKITIDCGSGVEIGKLYDEATPFWFVIPPVTFSKGFTVEVVNTEGCSMVLSTSSSKTIRRNGIRSMVEVETMFDNVYFEDDVFKTHCVGKYDTDKDGEISLQEAAAVTEIDCGTCGISSLVGIEHFTSLTTLYCYTNHLTSLDLSKNTALKVFDCTDNLLTSLDVSNCTALESLCCWLNLLTSLDVSKNTALESLNCRSNLLTSLDVSKNPALERLYCSENQLTSLDVSKNTALEDMDCSPMPTLSTLYVAQGQTIPGVTEDRNPYDIPSATKIVVVAVPQMVDLGLSVKWATFNVGASRPEEYGDYFAWGETEPKSAYNWGNYKYCLASYTTMTKYCVDPQYGTVDNKTVLEREDDVAQVKWGGSWRMPTADECTELFENCEWTRATLGNTEGYLVRGTKEGYTDNYIFLPECGYYIDNYLDYWYDFFSGGYWSSSLNLEYQSYNAGLLNLIWGLSGSYRCEGRAVRPVSD